MVSGNLQRSQFGFHTSEKFRVNALLGDEDEDILSIPSPFQLEPGRWKVITKVHEMIAKEWVNGGCRASFYRYDGNNLPNDLKIQAGHLIGALERIGDNRGFPSEISGCSIDYLRNGKIWIESLQTFGNAIYCALSQGGAYSKKRLAEDEAERISTDYLVAMFGDSNESSLYFFGLDIGFSCWFRGVCWDLAYAIVNTDERWIALIVATDTD